MEVQVAMKTLEFEISLNNYLFELICCKFMTLINDTKHKIFTQKFQF